MKRQKNDATDAEAIVIAARQPEMRFVEPKTPEQQAHAVLFRARNRVVRQRTELINALRATLYEFGQVVPLGIENIKRIDMILDDPEIDLPLVVREECRDLLAQISEKTVRIAEKTNKLAELAKHSQSARRLQTMPRRRADDCGGHRSLCADHAELPARPRLRFVVRSSPETVLIRWQRAAWADLESRSS